MVLARSLIAGTDADVVKLFYSYAREDNEIRAVIDRALGQFDWDVGVEPWYDGEIEAGEPWEEAIRRNLEEADIVLVLITSNLMQSEFCNRVEIPTALTRHRAGETRLVPILLEDTEPNWQMSKLRELQALPRNGVPLAMWEDEQAGIADIALGLLNIIVRGGLNPKLRVRSELQLDLSNGGLSNQETGRLIDRLREISGDPTLRMVGVRESCVLTIDGSPAAIDGLMASHRAGELTQLIGYPVISLKEFYGAGVQAGVRPGAVPQVGLPERQPEPQRMLLPTPAHRPPIWNVIGIHPNNLLRHEVLISPGDDELSDDDLAAEARAHIDYFFTALNAKQEDVYVNLAPDETAHMLSPTLSGTVLGQAMLELDFNLKRLSASLLHPETEIGHTFWQRALRTAHDRFGTTDIPFDICQRVWIVPTKSNVDPNFGDERLSDPAKPNSIRWVAIADAEFSVLSERQYYSGSVEFRDARSIEFGDFAAPIFEEVVLPTIREEVAQGRTFSQFRQILRALIFATWFKQEYGTHPSVAELVDRDARGQFRASILSVKPLQTFTRGEAFSVSPSCDHQASPNTSEWTTGAPDSIRQCLEEPDNREYYDRYMEVFRNGVFYVVRNDFDAFSHRKIVRSYFGGAIDMRRLGPLVSDLRFRTPHNIKMHWTELQRAVIIDCLLLTTFDHWPFP